MCRENDLDRWNTINLLSEQDAKILIDIIEREEEDGGITPEEPQST
jgi:hypothetical protein